MHKCLHLAGEVVGDRCDLATVDAHLHRRIGFVRQAVRADVFDSRIHCKSDFQIGADVVKRLPRDGVDEIDASTVDSSFSSMTQRALNAGGLMPSLECFEVFAVERLGADADTVDSACHQRVHEFRRDRFGVALDGELTCFACDRVKIEQVLERGEQFAPKGRSEKAGCAASKENRTETCIGVSMRSQRFEFSDEGIDERRLPILGINEAVKVAVVALVKAERDVDVERPGQLMGQLEGVVSVETCGSLGEGDPIKMRRSVHRLVQYSYKHALMRAGPDP